MEQIITTCILSTGMNMHRDLLEQARHVGRSERIRDCARDELAEADATLFASLILHSADLSNPAKPWKLAEHWTGLIMQEFFEQGELEKLYGMPVSASCDAFTTDVAELQIKFIRAVAVPTFETLKMFLPKIETALSYTKRNLRQWHIVKERSLTVDQRSLLREMSGAYRDQLKLVRYGTQQFSLPKHMTSSKLRQLVTGCRNRLKWFGHTHAWHVWMTVLTCYALFADEIRSGYCPHSLDYVFDTLTAATLIFFTIELICNCIADPKFGGSFYFWFDLISTASLILDITTLPAAFCNNIHLCRGLDSVKSIRISRTVRWFNLSRTTRLLKRFEAVKRFTRRQSKTYDSKNASGSTLFPLAALSDLFDGLDRDKKGCLGVAELDVLMNIAYNGVPMPQNTGHKLMSVLLLAGPEKPKGITKSVFIAGIQNAMKAQEKSETLTGKTLDHRSVLGRKISDIATRRLIVLVLSILFVTPSLSNTKYDYDQGQDYGLRQLHGYTRGVWPIPPSSSIENEIRFFITSTQPIFMEMAIATVDMSNTTGLLQQLLPFKDPVQVWEEYRESDVDIVGVYGCTAPFVVSSWSTSPTVSTESACISTAYFDKTEYRRAEAFFNICRTLASIACLVLGALIFEWDTNRLVIKPIERMVSVVEQLAANPLAKVKIQPQEANHVNEIQLLENTFVKIANLIQIGFGEAGAEIIAENMPAGDFNPMIAGKKIHAVFGFCDIRRFTDTTECLSEQVMIFTNIIGDIVHGAVNRFGGTPNKNIGDAFLLVWKIPETSVDVAIINRARLNNAGGKTRCTHFFDVESTRNIAPLQKQVESSLLHDLSSKSVVKRTSMAERALMAFLKIQLDISNSKKLADYSHNPRLLVRFDPPYIVKLGYGLHAGWAIEGAIGSRYKIDASYLSSDVNMSQRLEELTKVYKTPLLMTHVFRELLSESTRQLCRCVDSVTLSGAVQTTGLYDFTITDTTVETIEDSCDLERLQASLPQEFRYANKIATQHFIKEEWDASLEWAEQAHALKPDDGPTQYLLAALKSHTGFNE